MASTPVWHGVHVATALPMTDDLEIDFDAYAEHVAWLAENGCDGVCPNGSLGEYQTLTDAERARVVEVAVKAAPPGFGVMPGVGAYGSSEARRWTEQAAEAGATSVLSLPPNAYRADENAVLEHYRAVASVGLPVIAYDNPLDTKVALRPELLARLHGEGLVVGVKEFSGDVRRAYVLGELVPELDILVGSDDLLLELGIAGAVGWIAGYPNMIPRSSVELYRAATSGDGATWEQALPTYRALHPLLRWDSQTEFVQSIKLSMDLAGRRGGPTRPPRMPLPPEQHREITEATERVLAAGFR